MFWLMLAFKRICETFPSNVSRGSELTVNRTTCPSWIEPMSASLTDDQISSRSQVPGDQEQARGVRARRRRSGRH